MPEPGCFFNQNVVVKQGVEQLKAKNKNTSKTTKHKTSDISKCLAEEPGQMKEKWTQKRKNTTYEYETSKRRAALVLSSCNLRFT